MPSPPHCRWTALGDREGFTLVEVVAAAAIIGVVMLSITRLFIPLLKYFQRSQARQAANTEARVCLENIERVLSNARVSTLDISTPILYVSQAHFLTMDGSTYDILWSTGPTNAVHLRRTPPGGLVANDTLLATHVTGLFYTWDMNDPAIIYVNLRLTAPLDSSGSPDSFLTILLPPLEVRLRGS